MPESIFNKVATPVVAASGSFTDTFQDSYFSVRSFRVAAYVYLKKHKLQGSGALQEEKKQI